MRWYRVSFHSLALLSLEISFLLSAKMVKEETLVSKKSLTYGTPAAGIFFSHSLRPGWKKDMIVDQPGAEERKERMGHDARLH